MLTKNLLFSYVVYEKIQIFGTKEISLINSVRK